MNKNLVILNDSKTQFLHTWTRHYFQTTILFSLITLKWSRPPHWSLKGCPAMKIFNCKSYFWTPVKSVSIELSWVSSPSIPLPLPDAHCMQGPIRPCMKNESLVWEKKLHSQTSKHDEVKTYSPQFSPVFFFFFLTMSDLSHSMAMFHIFLPSAVIFMVTALLTLLTAPLHKTLYSHTYSVHLNLPFSTLFHRQILWHSAF